MGKYQKQPNPRSNIVRHKPEHGGKGWTRARLDALEELWKASGRDYLNGRQIAAQLNERFPGFGTTRGAVIGKAARTGLATKYSRLDKAPGGVRDAKRSPPSKPKSDPMSIAETPSLDPRKAMPMRDAMMRDLCLYPLEGVESDLVCGCDRCPGTRLRPSSYCATHRAQASQPLRPKALH